MVKQRTFQRGNDVKVFTDGRVHGGTVESSAGSGVCVTLAGNAMFTYHPAASVYLLPRDRADYLIRCEQIVAYFTQRAQEARGNG